MGRSEQKNIAGTAAQPTSGAMYTGVPTNVFTVFNRCPELTVQPDTPKSAKRTDPAPSNKMLPDLMSR